LDGKSIKQGKGRNKKKDKTKSTETLGFLGGNGTIEKGIMGRGEIDNLVYYSQFNIGKPDFRNRQFPPVNGIQRVKRLLTGSGLLKRMQAFSGIPANGADDPDTGNGNPF
jgi:hypothetical protein